MDLRISPQELCLEPDRNSPDEMLLTQAVIDAASGKHARKSVEQAITRLQQGCLRHVRLQFSSALLVSAHHLANVSTDPDLTIGPGDIWHKPMAAPHFKSIAAQAQELLPRLLAEEICGSYSAMVN